MALWWKTVIVVLLLQVVNSRTSAISNFETFGRYLKREERGTPSKLRFTSGSYGFYNTSIIESRILSTIKCDMKMGIYIYDSRTEIVFEVDDKKRFSVRSEKIEDFILLRVIPNIALNSDIQSVHTINVVASDNHTREEIDRTKIYLHVLDLNEFKPSFLNNSLEISIKENFEIGKPFHKVKAVDPDSGLNGELYYFISPSQDLSVGDFSLHPHTGSLSLVKPLNFKRCKSYTFYIYAKDKCPIEVMRKQSDKLSVRINVISVPDFPKFGRRRGKRQDFFDPAKTNNLRFTKPVYVFSVPEISPPFTPLVRVELNKSSVVGMPSVNFGFFKGNEQGRFEINSKTGQIYTIRELDYEKTKHYNLTVIAYHRSLIKGRTSVIIKVSDSNDHSPTFPKLQDEVDVLEETAIGTVVYRANATDLDTGVNKKIFYSIGNLNTTYFEIDQFTGDLRVAKRLDRDGEKSVSPIMYLMIKASDFGVPVKREGRMILMIKVKAVNDNPPVLQYTKCRIVVARNARQGSPVMKVNALDLDITSAQTIFGVSGGDFLNIGSLTGHVTLKYIPNGLKESSVFITAADGKSFGKILNLTIAFVPENSGKKVNMTCIDNPEYNEVKDIISKRENHEKRLSTEKFSDIVMPQRRPHKPIILEKPDTVITLREDLPIGSFVTRVLAVDKELHCYGLVLYSIVSGNYNMDSNFAIDMLNGTVYLAGKIDREQNPSYNLKIRAWDTDSSPQYTDVDLQIDVSDVNDNGPVFTQNTYEVTVSEGTHPGTEIAHLQAKDPDRGPNGKVMYSLVNDVDALFSLNEFTGHLTLEKMLDYEKNKEHTLIIQAVDSSSQNQQVSQASVIIKVTDINDTPPKCMPNIQTFEVTKDFPPGAVLGKILAYDPDTGDGGKFRFELESGKAQRLFSLDSVYGILRTNGNTMSKLVYGLVYNVSVIVSDIGAPSLSTTCYIVCVLKSSLSHERPKFLRQRDENLVIVDIVDPNSIVAIEATFEGSGEMEYSLVDGTGIGDFAIDSKSGVLSRTGSQQAHVSHYWLTVNAHLKEHPEVYSNIAVLLRERNVKKEAPYFDPSAYRSSIKENLPAYTEVLQLSVVNRNSDLSESLVFKIIEGNDLGHFEVTTKGLIRTTQELDREQIASYQMNVSVSNPNLPKQVTFASVFVTVQDVNDNDPEPIIKDVPGTLEVLEQNLITVGNGTFLAQVAAVDRDEGESAELVYQLSSEGNKIEIDSKTGVLTSKAALTIGEFFMLDIKICDRGGRCIHQFREVVVVGKPMHHLRVLRFKKKTFTYQLRESTQPLLEPKIIVHVASLLTSGQKPGELLKFSIESGNEDRLFALMDLQTAMNLFQISELDYETKQEHNIVIKVTNGQTSDTATIKITLIDVNDNAPTTSQSCYEAEAMENVEAGQVITQIEGELCLADF